MQYWASRPFVEPGVRFLGQRFHEFSTFCPVIVNIIVLPSGFPNVGFVVIACRGTTICVMISYSTCVKFFCIVCFLFAVVGTSNINVSCGNFGKGVRRISETSWGFTEFLRPYGGPQNF